MKLVIKINVACAGALRVRHTTAGKSAFDVIFQARDAVFRHQIKQREGS